MRRRIREGIGNDRSQRLATAGAEDIDPRFGLVPDVGRRGLVQHLLGGVVERVRVGLEDDHGGEDEVEGGRVEGGGIVGG